MDSRRQTAMAVLDAALRAVDPAEAVRRHVSRQGDALHRRRPGLRPRSATGASLSSGAARPRFPWPTRCRTSWANGSPPASSTPSTATWLQAATRGIGRHPGRRGRPPDPGRAGPGRRGAHGRAAAGGRRADDLVICLISGGGSALMALPAPGITLADKQAATQALLACGATINEVNSVRKHLSHEQGRATCPTGLPGRGHHAHPVRRGGQPAGRHRQRSHRARPVHLRRRLRVLARYGVLDKVPPAVRQRLEDGRAGRLAETPNGGASRLRAHLQRGGGRQPRRGPGRRGRGRRLGFNSLLLSTSVEGEAREIAKFFAALAREIEETGAPLPAPACLIAGGETTVTLRGHGKGGRNQEMALSAAIKIAGLQRTLIVCAPPTAPTARPRRPAPWWTATPCAAPRAGRARPAGLPGGQRQLRLLRPAGRSHRHRARPTPTSTT